MLSSIFLPPACWLQICILQQLHRVFPNRPSHFVTRGAAMHEEGRLPVRAAAEVPQPNVKRTAGGEFATLLSGLSASCGRIGRRLQRIGCLFHLGMPGWDWDQWRTWRRPRRRGDHRAYHASVESSLQPGHYTDVVVLYPELDDKQDKKDRAHIRHAAKLLCNTHRSVRHEDGSVGKMVGAGDHLSYNGLVEVRR